MTTKSQYISLYTLPAVDQSIIFFEEEGIYTFSEYKNSKFKENEYKKADYVGIGKDFRLEEKEKKYMQIERIAKISEIGKFEIDFDETNLTHFAITKGEKVEKSILKNIVQQHIDAYHKYGDGHISSETKKKKVYIYVKPEDIIEIEENVLYPTKSLVSFPLNTDTNGNYIPSQNLVKTLKITENVYLHLERNILIVEGGEIQIGSNNKTYGKIIELLTKSENGTCNVKDVGAKDNPGDNGNLEKNFNKASFCKYLDFIIKISANSIISKQEKTKKS